MTQRDLKFWRNSAVLFALIALLKGIRLPGSWAMSQIQITYVCGLVKRGLQGQALYSLHIRSARAVRLFCLLELAVLVVLVAVFTWRSGLLAKRGKPVIVAAFAGSYAVTYLAHLVGYQDIALYVLALSVVLLQHHHQRFLFALPVCILAPLIHENFLLTALPVMLFSFFVERDPEKARKAYLYALILLSVSGLITARITLLPLLTGDNLQRFVSLSVARAQYRVDPHILGVVGISTPANIALNLNVIEHNWWWWAESFCGLLTIGPLVALLACSARKEATGVRWTAFVYTSAAPLLLNVIGWDSVRWMSLCALSTYSNLGILHRSVSMDTRHAFKSWELHAAIIVLALGLASGHGLMDAEKINPYPFFPPIVRPAVIHHDGPFGNVL